MQHLVSSTIDGNTLNVNYLNFNTNKPKRFRELYGDNVRVDEFYTDSRFDQPMIDMAHVPTWSKATKSTKSNSRKGWNGIRRQGRS